MRAMFILSPHRWKLAALACLVSALASCLSTPEPKPWSAPPCEAEIEHFAGNSLVGRKVAEEAEPSLAADSGGAIGLRIEMRFLEAFPSQALHPVMRKAELHSADGANPIRVVAGRNALARVGFGDEAREFQLSQETKSESLALIETVLPDGVAVSAEFRSLENAFAVELARSGSEFVPALVTHIADVAGAKREVSTFGGSGLANGSMFTVIVPVDAGAVMWRFEFTLADVGSEEHQKRFEACMAQVNANFESVRDRIRPLDPRDLELRRLNLAVGALEIVKFHRPALVYLAAQAGASTAEAMAWLAEDELLQACVGRVLESQAKLGSAEGREQTAWQLERACYQELAVRFSRGELPPEMVSILFRHAGELGRYPGLLDDVLIESSNQEELDGRLVSENRLFLTDRDPAARVRAFDWLDTRGVAPASFDPLASKEARRAALTENK